MRYKGLTVVEILVILSVLALVLTLAGSSLLGFRRQLTLEDAANTLSQDIQTCRTEALSKARNCRIRFTGEHTYVVETGGGSGYTILTSRNLPGFLTISSPTAGSWLEFDPRTVLTPSPGFPTVGPGANAPEIKLTNGSKTLRLVISMVGAVKTVWQ
ncbi:prepilin-type cleavage/methylation domain-containing protein [Thermus scotoductus]|uniref:Prepilin-type cleavage/methylation domain-containing protein n=1 Tax=Thermus scotoductus TaxID=37636 RepID=A0A430S1X7_THESC|nr:prepilin-type cleavage/methylation domain-containing protein [Thermus scotoductus]RTH03664.1 prepilin-type cleavage/methylation domain-containing protein [Thermus scotoductus]RTH27665.1 prepilin-type cleavage/methylation domain-containing protein [Thermus scotoductus]RTH97898.1 prepilin-type cleavage/methylation domain-containing protein [Thermus scotoductus]